MSAQMVKKLVKKIGMTVAPAATLELLSARSQQLIIRIERQTGRLDASKAFIARHGRTVLDGPFKGMVYPETVANERNLVHRLVGSYESELHPWISEIAAKAYPMLLDIGTADGFYAAGFARLMPQTKVIGFDTDRWARKATQALFDENHVLNAEVQGMCDARWINRHLAAGSMVFSDCEGFEAVLFDPALCPVLTQCDMLIELHERPAPGVEMLLRSRFEQTHDCRVVTYADHDPARFPWLADVPPEMRAAVLSEGRGGPQNVIFLTRRAA